MATFFGEVILPSSRAFFEDFDDSDLEEDNAESTKPRLNITCHQKEIASYDALIVSDGAVASGFVQQYMLKSGHKLVAEIELLNEKEDTSELLIVKPKRVDSTKLYLLSNNCLILQISNIDLGLANQLTLLVSPWLSKCKRVLSLVSRHVSSYRCDSINELPSAFVRCLATTTQPFPKSLRHLEQPNFISDVPASILSWCEGQQIPGLMLILYTDQTSLDVITITPLLKVFSDADLSQYINRQQNLSSFTDPLKNMEKTFMYM